MADRHHWSLLTFILASGLVLRLCGAWYASLTFDERAHLALAETVDLRPDHVHLVSRTLDHPFLSIYVLRLGGAVLGKSDFALRLPYVLAGTATILVVYFIGRRAFSPPAGLWAAALLAVDQFHAGWSRVFMPEVLMLLLAALAILQFLRIIQRKEDRLFLCDDHAGMVPAEGPFRQKVPVPFSPEKSNRTLGNWCLLGALLGLGCLAKEPAILLVPAFWLFLLITPSQRGLLCRPGWYLAHLAAILVITPDLLWNASILSESYLSRDLAFAHDGLRLSLKPLSLYLGEWFNLLRRDALGKDYRAGNLYACQAIAGIVYLAAIVVSLSAWRHLPVRVLLIVFGTVAAVFAILPGGAMFEPFWWASLSLIPAVVCAGGMFDRLTQLSNGAETRVAFRSVKERGFRGAKGDNIDPPALSPVRTLVGVAIVAGLGVAYLPSAGNPGVHEPRATVRQFVDDFIAKGNEALAHDELREAESRFIYALNIGGPDADAYRGLAQVAAHRGQPQTAAAFLEKCRRLEP
jgi:4-amino-4-deoxy-L-arabinose transferase-like glycosyltransferase